MKVNTFDGGLSVRVSDTLILPNEAVLYNNIDSANLLLKSCKGTTNLSIVVGGYFYNFKDQWLSSSSERSYVEYKNFLYYTETDKRPMKYDGARESFIGIAAPEEAPVATQQDPSGSEKISSSSSTLQYTYTYYNSADGIESAPAPVSAELSLAANKVVDLDNIVASEDIQVDMIRIYRLGDGLTTMSLVEEIANETVVYRDDTLTLDIIGSILDTYNNQTPDNTFKYLTEAYGIMFAASGSKLRFSEIGKPDYWPAENQLEFGSDLTGILPVPNGLLIHQRNKTDLLVGADSAAFRVLPVTTEQGSVSHVSGKLVTNIPVWVSLDGICTYSSGIIQVISKDKLGKTALSIVNTVVYDEQYFICLSDGSLLCLDARFNTSYKKYNFSVPLNNIAVYNDELYGRFGDFLHKIFDGDEVSFTYKSPRFTEGEHTVVKLYNNVYIRSEGTFEVKIYIDKDLVLTKEITGNKIHDVKVPQEKQRGSDIQFEITGTGTIYEYEYKVVGRDNGR